MSAYTPEKWIWTEADFDKMGWHDVHIHALAFQSYTLAFDIDYMFRWVDPVPGETYYKFWMSPATLLFENVSDLRITLEPHGDPIIMGVIRSEPVTASARTTWSWQFDCLEGDIVFRATGYRQFTRRPPALASKQFFADSERGVASFSQATPDCQIG